MYHYRSSPLEAGIFSNQKRCHQGHCQTNKNSVLAGTVSNWRIENGKCVNVEKVDVFECDPNSKICYRRDQKCKTFHDLCTGHLFSNQKQCSGTTWPTLNDGTTQNPAFFEISP